MMMTTVEEQQIRTAAESLLSGSVQSQRSSYTHRSINSINRDFICREDLIGGSRNNGKMSNVRRFFCLLVTFDLLFTCLMWLICTTIAGENISTAFVRQVLHYQIKSSLFDIIMAAVCRFTVLLLFYALLYINHWWIVALSTASTCAFLGAKAYFFNWADVPQPGFQALMILTSFVLAWSEAWYFDCRVVPQESRAEEWLLASGDSDRAPLLRHAFDGPSNRIPDNMGMFFTPMDSPTHSDDEDEHCKPAKIDTTDDDFLNLLQGINLPLEKSPYKHIDPLLSKNEEPLRLDIDEFKKKASFLISQSHSLLTSNEWQQINTTSNGDVISVMNSSYGKILKIEGTINVAAPTLINTLHENVEDMPSWNKDLSVVKKIQTIDMNTDIVYQATKTCGAGLIGPREFITLRHRNQCGKFYMSSGISVHVNLPHRKNHIRGENGIVCLAAENVDENKSHVIWLMHTNLKGWIPQRIIDSSLAGMLDKMISSMRCYVDNWPAN